MAGKKWAGRIGRASFLTGFLIELLVVIVEKSDLPPLPEGQIFRLTFVLFLVAALCTEYTLRECAAVGFFGLVALISWRVSGRDELVRFVVFAAACKCVAPGRIFRMAFWVTLAGCAALVFLSATGLFGAVSWTADFGRGYEQTRYCLGMGHPNALHCMALMLLVTGLYLYNGRLRWWVYPLLLLGNAVLFRLTDSRTGALVAYGTIFLAGWMRYGTKFWSRRWVYWAGGAFVAALYGLSVWLTLHYQHRLDRFFNMRFWNAIVVGGASPANWTWFSSPDASVYFDLGYIRLFYWYGIIPGLLSLVLVGLVCAKLGRDRDRQGLLLVLCCSVYTFVEAHLVSVYIGRHLPLMLLGCLWYRMPGVSGGRRVWPPALWRRRTGDGEL